MLLHGDGTNGGQNNTFLDSSTNNFTITRNGNTTQGSFSPYGSNWSNYFVRSSSQYLTVSNAGGQFSFGTGAFTIECWVNLASMPSGTGYPASYWIFGGGPSNSNPGIDFYINDTQIGFNLANFSSPTAIGNHGMSVGVWYHVAVVRGGGSNQTVSIYVNGTRVATASSVTATADAATSGIAISAAEPSGATGGNFDGYISNYRIVKGTAVYDPTQATITVPVAPLTAITNTQLLTCQSNRFIDNSSNAFAITVNSTPSVQRFSPFAPSAAYSTATIGGSGYFDGSGDYLVSASSAALSPGSGAVTMDCWIYMTATGSGNKGILTIGNANSTGNALQFIQSGTTLYINDGSGSNVTLGTIPLNAWTHIALSREGSGANLTYGYINGVKVATTTYSSNFSSPMSAKLGTTEYGSSGGSEIFTGYIANARVVIGSALYTGATYIVPTAPVSAVSGTQLLCNFTNGAIFDNAMMNDLETVGNAQISTSVKKYGTGSLAFDGSGDYLTAPSNSLFNFGSGDFTMEGWFYQTGLSSSYPGLVSNPLGWGNAGAWAVLSSHAASGVRKLQFYCYNYSSTTPLLLGTTTLSDNTWYYFTVTRSGSTFRLFLNGTIEATTTFTGNLTTVDNGLAVGINQVGSGYTYQGYIDDLRITKGYARYTANFTPPTAAFPNN